MSALHCCSVLVVFYRSGAVLSGLFQNIIVLPVPPPLSLSIKIAHPGRKLWTPAQIHWTELAVPSWWPCTTPDILTRPFDLAFSFMVVHDLSGIGPKACSTAISNLEAPFNLQSLDVQFKRSIITPPHYVQD